MTHLAVGDSVFITPFPGGVFTLASIVGTNATITKGAYSEIIPLSALSYYGAVSNVNSALRVENSGAATPVLYPTDATVSIINAATTGVTARNDCPVNQTIRLTNLTGADFTTGDFPIPNGGTWLAYWDGTAWQTIQPV